MVKSELRVLVGGESDTLGRMDVMRVDLEVELGRCSVMLTLLQDLQHMRW